MQHEASVAQLSHNLRDPHESAMVRHECAEALGSIATDECTEVLEEYLQDSERVVKESCIVALDMSEYEHSNAFQYADSVTKVKDSQVNSLHHVSSESWMYSIWLFSMWFSSFNVLMYN